MIRRGGGVDAGGMKGDGPFELGRLEERVLLAATLVNAGATATVYDEAGALHVAYYDTVQHVLKYAARSAAGAWDPAVVVDATPYAGGEVSIALDAAGRPGIAYYEGTNRDLKFAQKGKRAWAVQTIDSAGTVGHNPSLAYTADGFPLVSYYATSAADLRLASFNGTRWYVTTIDAAGSVGRFSDIAISPADGSWAVAYESQSDRTIRYAQKWGKSFTTRVIDSMEGGAAWEARPQLGFNAAGNPVVGYVDNGDLVLNRAGRKSWARAVGPNGSATSLDFAMFVEPASGAARVLYTDWQGNFVLNTATTDGVWTKSSLLGERPLATAVWPTGQIGVLRNGGAVIEVGPAGTPWLAPDLALRVDAATADHVTLSWSGVPTGATHLTVERSVVGQSDVLALIILNPGTTTWTDATVTEGLAYVYRVRVGKDDVQAPATDAATARADLPPAFAGGVEVQGNAGVSLAWYDASEHEAGYRVERSDDGGAHFVVLAESFQSSGFGGYHDSTAAEDTTYTYRVTAVGAFADSAPAVVTLTTGFWAPTGLTAAAVFPTSVRLTWSDNSQHEGGFALSISSDGGQTWNYLYNTPANTTELLVTGLARGQSYGFRVTSDVGWSPNAEGIDVAYVDLPLSMPGAAPGDLAATTDAHAVHLTWVDQTSGETGWRVRRSEDGGVTFMVIAELPAGAQGYDDTGRLPSHTYVYQVVPVAGGAEGDAGTVTAITAPDLPLLLSGQALFRDLIQLNWYTLPPDVQSLEIRYVSPVDGRVHTMVSGVDPSLKQARIGSLEGGQPFAGLTYTVWLVAIGAGGATEGNPVSIDTSTGMLGLSASAISTSSLRLTWASVYGSFTMYDVWWSTDGVSYKQRALTTATDLNVTGLLHDAPYWFKIRLVGPSGGTTAFADPIMVRTLA